MKLRGGVASLALLGGLGLVGCVQKSEAGPPSTLPALVGTSVGPTTTHVLVPIGDVNGYVVSVIDGTMFELQVKQATQPAKLSRVVVPPLGTCEGDAAKQWLTTVIFGHPVRIDGNGVVWLGDVDVSKAMVAYGYAKAADGTYAGDDAAGADFDCSATTTSTTVPLPVVVIPAAPKATRPKPKVTVAATDDGTDGAAVPAPVVTDAQQTDPQEQSPLATDPPETHERPKDTAPPAAEPKETKPEKTDPPQQAPDTVDATPRTPRAPETPRTPAPPDAT